MTALPAYEQDPYRTQLDVEIVELGENEGRPYVVLDRTILFPEGGGQPPDHGRLGAIAVIDVQKVDGEVRHYLEAPWTESAKAASLTLDWARRYDHMQQHTAQHLLSALALERFGWATRSFHLGAETSDIELDAAELSASDLEALETAAAAEIAAARPITTRRVSESDYAGLEVRSRGLPAGHRGDVRLVEIEGVDRNTCGGTHLRSTSEIESIKVVGTERLRGGSRVRWVAGSRVRARLDAHQTRAAQLRALLDTDDAGMVEIVSQKLEQLGRFRRRIRRLEADLAQARAAALAATDDPVVAAHFEDADGGFLQQTGRALIAAAPGKVCLLTATGNKGSFFLLAAGSESTLEAAEVGPSVAKILEGRGGGSGSLFQGKAGSLAQREQALALVRAAIESG